MFSGKNSPTVKLTFWTQSLCMKDKQDIPRAVEFKYSRHRGQGDVYTLGWQVSVIAFKRGKKSKWNTGKKQGSGCFPTLQTQKLQWQTSPKSWGCGQWLRRHSDRLIVKGKTLGPIWNDDIYVTYKYCMKENAIKRRQRGAEGMLLSLILKSILQLPDKQPST